MGNDTNYRCIGSAANFQLNKHKSWCPVDQIPRIANPSRFCHVLKMTPGRTEESNSLHKILTFVIIGHYSLDYTVGSTLRGRPFLVEKLISIILAVFFFQACSISGACYYSTDRTQDCLTSKSGA